LAVIPSLFTGLWGEWIMSRFDIFGVSCPCALVVSIPLSFFAGKGGSSKKEFFSKALHIWNSYQKQQALHLTKREH
jgi:Cd2+/Zn2+-exporting ATPase